MVLQETTIEEAIVGIIKTNEVDTYVEDIKITEVINVEDVATHKDAIKVGSSNVDLTVINEDIQTLIGNLSEVKAITRAEVMLMWIYLNMMTLFMISSMIKTMRT